MHDSDEPTLEAQGNTAIMLAAQAGRAHNVRDLIIKGRANSSHVNKQVWSFCYTCLICMYCGHQQSVHLLEATCQ